MWGAYYTCLGILQEQFADREAISSFEITSDWCAPTSQYAIFYTTPEHNSLDDYSPAQKFDYDLCNKMNFFVRDFLSY